MVDVQGDYPELKRSGGELLVVTMGTPLQSAEFRAKLKSELTFLADPRQEAYRAYGLRRGSWREVVGPKVWLPGLKALVRSGAGKPIGDVWQMPGAFVIDQQGIIRYAHYPTDQAQRPSQEEIIAVLRSLA